MKIFPPGLDTLLDTGVFVFADLYQFTLSDGVTNLYYTTADTDVLYNGNTYTSKGPFFESISSASRGHWKAGLDVDTWTITVMPASPSDTLLTQATIYSQPWLSAVRAGALDGATVDVHRLYLPTWPSPWSSPIKITSYLDPLTITANIALSNNNLTALATHATPIESGAHTVSGVSDGAKIYFEVHADFDVSGTQSFGVGVGSADAVVGGALTLASYLGGTNNAGIGFWDNTHAYVNNVSVVTMDAYGTGDTIGIAVDRVNDEIWFRVNSGNWNGSALANPATNVGGISIAFIPTPMYVWIDFEELNYQGTFNFGASAFSHAAPSGFTDLTAFVLVDLFAGRVAQVELDRTQAIITINSHIEMLTRQMPRNVYSSLCRHTLFDAGCSLNRATFAVTGTVGTVTNNGTFETDLSQAYNYFSLGYLTWLTGANTGFSKMIRSHAGTPTGGLVLLAPMPFTVATGDTFTAYPGCDKTQSTCTNTFANLANFGGQPYIPTPETAT